MNIDGYIRCQKAELWIRKNSTGNPFATHAPKLGTLRQELTRVRLLVDLPRDLRCEAAEQMATAAARTEGGSR